MHRGIDRPGGDKSGSLRSGSWTGGENVCSITFDHGIVEKMTDRAGQGQPSPLFNTEHQFQLVGPPDLSGNLLPRTRPVSPSAKTG